MTGCSIGDLNSDSSTTYWSHSSIVTSIGTIGAYPVLCLDANDYARISFSDDSNDNVKYAAWNGSTWEIETVNPSGYACLGVLDLDSSDNPNIVYLFDIGGCS